MIEWQFVATRLRSFFPSFGLLYCCCVASSHQPEDGFITVSLLLSLSVNRPPLHCIYVLQVSRTVLWQHYGTTHTISTYYTTGRVFGLDFGVLTIFNYIPGRLIDKSPNRDTSKLRCDDFGRPTPADFSMTPLSHQIKT